jgi:hypothetical protein
MRKEKEITIEADNRDKGKVYILHEMSSAQGEKWGLRAMLALGKSKLEIPPELMSQGLAGIAALGIRAFGSMEFEDAEPLMDEMMACFEIRPDPINHPSVQRRLMAEEDIEEVSTRVQLRAEWWALHTGFSIDVVLSRLKAVGSAIRTLDASTLTSQS